MLKNINFNLFESITVISKSLYRYDTYLKDASECEPCKDIWKKFKEHREMELSMLLKELKDHIDSGKVSLDHHLQEYKKMTLS
jgi:hypothetical protein